VFLPCCCIKKEHKDLNTHIAGIQVGTTCTTTPVAGAI
jgi:hypothetical protein